MINIKNVQKFCKEEVSLIENYDKAMNDTSQTWDCHHRLEIELNMSRAELIEKDLYYNRPASELIFLTKSEHSKIHTVGERNPMYGKINPMYGKNAEDYMSPEAVKEKRRKQSKGVTGKKNGRYHTKQMYKDGEYKTVKYENIEEHLNDGWIIKGKGWYK